MGNCGFTLAPVRDDERALVVRNLERAEDIDPAALADGIDWSFETFPEYLDAVDALAEGHQLRREHRPLRAADVGDGRARLRPSANDDDLALMKHQLAAAIRPAPSGSRRHAASTTRHPTTGPSPRGSRRGTRSCSSSVSWATSARASSKAPTAACWRPIPSDGRARSPGCRDLAATSRVPITFGLVATRGAEHLLDFLDEAAAAGGRVIAQTHCRGISVLLSFKTRAALRPAARVARPPCPARSRAAAGLRDPATRRPAASTRPATPSYARADGVGAQARPPDFEGIRVYEHGLPPNPSVADVARERGVHPVEAMIDSRSSPSFEQLFIQPSRYPQDEEVLLRALRHPRTVMTFSDSGAHLSQIADSSIHTHLLGHWVRDRQEFTLEEAMRMITLAPALAWGFADRGLVREGMGADLNVFDPRTVGPAVPRLVDDLPGRRPAGTAVVRLLGDDRER